jgi:hypothetical protein
VRATAAIRELFTGFELRPPGLTDVRTFTDPTFAYSPDDPAPGIWMLCAAASSRADSLVTCCGW